MKKRLRKLFFGKMTDEEIVQHTVSYVGGAVAGGLCVYILMRGKLRENEIDVDRTVLSVLRDDERAIEFMKSDSEVYLKLVKMNGDRYTVPMNTYIPETVASA